VTTRTTQPFTLVSFHAHPDDEALLTGGTLARAAAAGHRVVLVTATGGEAGLADGTPEPAELGRRRRAELAASARVLGVARLVELGYPDSGHAPGPATFASLSPDEPAARLAQVLREEGAQVLTSYDPAGGYGHPDHVQVHRVGALAAATAGTPVLLEATVDRQSIARAASVLRRLSRVTPMPDLPDLSCAFTSRSDITHRVDVRAHLPAKLAALRAHDSQAGSADGRRTIALLLRLPPPLRAWVLGAEWFRDALGTASSHGVDDVFGPTVRRRTAVR
jgi:LmbE family N-acetylglucosaminyl deacetylase